MSEAVPPSLRVISLLWAFTAPATKKRGQSPCLPYRLEKNRLWDIVDERALPTLVVLKKRSSSGVGSCSEEKILKRRFIIPLWLSRG
jgi:hypothetical protein